MLRRRVWAVVVCLAATGAVANAAETAAGPYLGVRGGISESSLNAGDVEQRLAGAGFAMDVSIDDRESTWSLFGGYRWANGLGIEASYVDLGEFDVSMAGSTSNPGGLLPAAADGLADAGWGGAVTLGWQWSLTSSFAITPRIGMYYWESERELANAAGSVKTNESATEVTGGIARCPGASAIAGPLGSTGMRMTRVTTRTSIRGRLRSNTHLARSSRR